MYCCTLFLLNYIHASGEPLPDDITPLSHTESDSCTVMITADTKGARVYLDKVFAGFAPDLVLTVPHGEHEIRLVDFYTKNEYSKILTVDGPEAKVVDFVLNSSWIGVGIKPPDSKVFYNGELVWVYPDSTA